jgi:hypothetical protein
VDLKAARRPEHSEFVDLLGKKSDSWEGRSVEISRRGKAVRQRKNLRRCRFLPAGWAGSSVSVPCLSWRLASSMGHGSRYSEDISLAREIFAGSEAG